MGHLYRLFSPLLEGWGNQLLLSINSLPLQYLIAAPNLTHMFSIEFGVGYLFPYDQQYYV